MGELATEQRTRAAAQATTARAHGVPAEQHAQNNIYHQTRGRGSRRSLTTTTTTTTTTAAPAAAATTTTTTTRYPAGKKLSKNQKCNDTSTSTMSTTSTTTTTTTTTTSTTSRPPPLGPTLYLKRYINSPRRRPVTVVTLMWRLLPGPSKRGLKWPSLRGTTC